MGTDGSDSQARYVHTFIALTLFARQRLPRRLETRPHLP